MKLEYFYNVYWKNYLNSVLTLDTDLEYMRNFDIIVTL